MNFVINKKTPTARGLYYQKNKERLKQKAKEYRRMHIERIECPCGKKIFIHNQRRHETSLYHRRYLYNTK